MVRMSSLTENSDMVTSAVSAALLATIYSGARTQFDVRFIDAALPSREGKNHSTTLSSSLTKTGMWSVCLTTEPRKRKQKGLPRNHVRTNHRRPVRMHTDLERAGVRPLPMHSKLGLQYSWCTRG